MKLVLQSTVIYILAVTLFISLLIMLFYFLIRKADPLEEPKGAVLLGIMAVEFVEKMVRDATNKEIAEKLAPYVGSIMLYIFLANIAGLFGIEPPTANYSVTLTLAAITCILIEVYAIRYKGAKGYIKGLFEPLAPFVIINIISKLGTLLSLSLRLFGNIMSGTILMSVIYQLFAMVSGAIPVIGQFNIFGVIVAPFLHMYFDLFSGVMQTYLFSTLTVSFIGNELPSEVK